MAIVQNFHLEHLPASYSIYVALFTAVTNAAFLQQQLIDGNTDFEYAFIDAGTIVSTSHILAAAYRAVNDALEDRLRSRNVHSEVVFSLSPNNNIAASFRNFGVTAQTTSLLALKITSSPSPTASEIQHHLEVSVQGTQVEFDDVTLEALTDWSRVKKLYKLGVDSDRGQKKKGKGRDGSITLNAEQSHTEPSNGVESEEGRRTELRVQVLGLMALRGLTT